MPKKLLLYVSQNEREHVYREGAEEGLIQQFEVMRSDGDLAKNKPENPRTSKGSKAKVFELLSQDYVKTMMECLLDAGGHFVHDASFKLTKFHEEMMSPYGGVSDYTVSVIYII